MNFQLSSKPIQILISYLLSLLGAFACYLIAQHWLPIVLWLTGHLLISFTINRLKEKPSTKSSSAIFYAGMTAGASLLFLLIATQFATHSQLGWRGFVHLTDLPLKVWGNLFALIPFAVGCWIISLRHLQLLHSYLPSRRFRLILLLCTSLILAFTSLIPGFEISFLSLFFSLIIYLFSLDIYLENDRTSMTWLLLWLLLISLLLAAFAYQQSLRIDQQSHQAITQDIVRTGKPDSARQYHLDFQWDTLSLNSAPQLLSADLLSIPPGTGVASSTSERNDWVYRRPDGKSFVIAGRKTTGFRPPLALTSVFFLSGLAYCLCLRGCSWLLGFPYQNWLLPLFGPGSLKVRIQLSFFVLALVALGLVGWFTIDFFREQPEFLSQWLEQLLSLYVFLLLIAGTFGIILANSISDPIVKIGKKIGDTRLQNNAPLQWPRDDEIGRLVANYNQMIVALDKSAAKLAATERESAWREMAKQVAHEIKNPLTPMKLQLQQLLRLEKEDPEKARAWSKRIANSIIEQIDGLALIATEFSSFARLPEAQATTFDLRLLVQSAYDLHSAGKPGDQISMQLPEQAAFVHADRDQLLRVLNNLINNANQALHQQDQPLTQLNLTVENNSYRLAVIDNGTGIPPAIQQKIFQPNFTTKSSGMGLGLAMCKAIVEQAEGSIDFETKPGEGTVFWVSLPRVKKEDT